MEKKQTRSYQEILIHFLDWRWGRGIWGQGQGVGITPPALSLSPWLSSLFSCKNCNGCFPQVFVAQATMDLGALGLCCWTGVHFQEGAISKKGN